MLNRLVFRRVLLLTMAVIFVTALIVFLIYFLGRRQNSLPEEFVSAWRTASRLSSEITALTSETNTIIQSVNVSDLAGRDSETSILINQARQKNKSAYDKAVELSLALQQLAQSIERLPTQKSQQAAYETVALALALISDFINYTQNLNQFLDSLAVAVVNNNQTFWLTVNRNLTEVNKKVASINQINNSLTEKIHQLDQSL